MLQTPDLTLIATVCDLMLKYYAGDPSRSQHLLKVHDFAAIIGCAEGLSPQQQRLLEIAALVHDIGIKPAEEKYGSCAGPYQEKEGPAPARALLAPLGITGAELDRICYLISRHHTYTNVDGIDYQILLEADFLVNLFENNTPKKNQLAAVKKIFKTRRGIELACDMFALDLGAV